MGDYEGAMLNSTMRKLKCLCDYFFDTLVLYRRVASTVGDKSMWIFLGLYSLFKIGPNNLSSFEKLEGLVC